MNILCIGDVVGRSGREALGRLLKAIREEFAIDFVIVNGENAAGGNGIIPKHAAEIFTSGADAITLGDHTWDKPEVQPLLKEDARVIRPANFPEGSPGRGFTVLTTHNGIKIGIINLLGRTFMRYNVNCPFRAFDDIVKQIKQETPIVIVDMHAETTSEKVAMGHYCDGRASLVFGTHTHIQTADEKILPQGCGYITDLGMSGPYDSVIGQDKGRIIQRFLTSMPVKFAVAEGPATLHGVIVSVDTQTGKTTQITRIQRT